MSYSFETLLVEDCHFDENIFPDLPMIILTSMENYTTSIKAIRHGVLIKNVSRRRKKKRRLRHDDYVCYRGVSGFYDPAIHTVSRSDAHRAVAKRRSAYAAMTTCVIAG